MPEVTYLPRVVERQHCEYGYKAAAVKKRGALTGALEDMSLPDATRH